MLTPDATRGRLDMLVLSILAERPTYGYALIKELRDRSNGAFDLPEGTVYPALHRLEAAGKLASTRTMANGRSRRYYSITPIGRAALTAEREAWNYLVAAVPAVTTTPVRRPVARRRRGQLSERRCPTHPRNRDPSPVSSSRRTWRPSSTSASPRSTPSSSAVT